MRKIVFTPIAALLMTLGSASAIAQASNFQGASVGIDWDYSNSKSTIHGKSLVNSDWVTYTETDTTTRLAGHGKYQHAFGKRFVMGIGGKFDLTNPDDGKLNSQGTHVSTGLRHKNAYSLYITPGLALNDTAMIYVKLGFTKRETKADTVQIDDSGNHAGIGLQYVISPKVYLQAEYGVTTWNGKNISTNPSWSAQYASDSGTFSTGMGYRF